MINGKYIYHVIEWHRGKQERISLSLYGAEIIGCADTDDRGYYLKTNISGIRERRKSYTHCWLIQKRCMTLLAHSMKGMTSDSGKQSNASGTLSKHVT